MKYSGDNNAARERRDAATKRIGGDISERRDVIAGGSGDAICK